MLKIPRVDLQRPLADFCVCYEKRQHPENEGLEDLNQVKLLRINQVGRVFVLKQIQTLDSVRKMWTQLVVLSRNPPQFMSETFRFRSYRKFCPESYVR